MNGDLTPFEQMLIRRAKDPKSQLVDRIVVVVQVMLLTSIVLALYFGLTRTNSKLIGDALQFGVFLLFISIIKKFQAIIRKLAK